MKSPNRRSNYAREWRESLLPSIMISTCHPALTWQILLLRQGPVVKILATLRKRPQPPWTLLCPQNPFRDMNGLIFRIMPSHMWYHTGRPPNTPPGSEAAWVVLIETSALFASEMGLLSSFQDQNSYTFINNNKEFLKRRTAFQTNTPHLWEPYNEVHHLQSGNTRGCSSVLITLLHSFSLFFFTSVMLFSGHRTK